MKLISINLKHLFAVVCIGLGGVGCKKSCTNYEMVTYGDLETHIARSNDANFYVGWTYVGSDDQFHYFQLQSITSFWTTIKGCYQLPKSSMDISPIYDRNEFRDDAAGALRWGIPAFHSTEFLHREFSIDNGVDPDGHYKR